MKKKPSGRNFKKRPFKARRVGAARPAGPAPAAKQAPPDGTLREVQYLKSLVANKKQVRIRLHDNQAVEGVVEYYDTNLIRLTRAGEANVLIYKRDIKYLEERV